MYNESYTVSISKEHHKLLQDIISKVDGITCMYCGKSEKLTMKKVNARLVEYVLEHEGDDLTHLFVEGHKHGK